MTNASRLPVTLDSNLYALAPEKVKNFLYKALNRGLTVWQSTNTTITVGTGWTIASPDNPIDDWQLWLYFIPGSRGGSLRITRYLPRSTKRSPTTKITYRMAGIVIDDMGDALDRHRDREAKKATAQAATVVQAVESANTARAAAVQELKATPPAAVDMVDADTQALAVAAVGSLKANGKFAIRTARNGRIWANTPAKVRTALVNRGLVHVSGGMLTELGRVVRSLMIA